MAQTIEHCGIIKEMDSTSIHVLIKRQTSCSECHAEDVCDTANKVEKIIEVENTDPLFNVGDSVLVTGKNSMGLQAVLFAFVLPFILMFISLLTLNTFITNEAISGGLAILTLLPYYCILSLFKVKLKTTFGFDVRKDSEVNTGSSNDNHFIPIQ